MKRKIFALILLCTLPSWAGRKFNGTSDQVSAPGTGTPDDITIGQMSFSCWFMLTSSPANEVDPCSKWAAGGGGGYNFSFNQTFSGSFANQLAGNIYISISLNHLHQIGCSATINLNQWYVATLVYLNNSSPGMKVWLGTNGVSTLCGSDNSVGSVGVMLSSGNNLLFAAPRILAGYGAIHMTGLVAETAVWNVRLSDQEAQALATVCPNSIRRTALVGYWPMSGASGTNPEPDLSGNGQNAVLTGTTVTNHPPCRQL
jgi:hypothetical protein